MPFLVLPFGRPAARFNDPKIVQGVLSEGVKALDTIAGLPNGKPKGKTQQ